MTRASDQALPPGIRGDCALCHLSVARAQPMFTCVNPRCGMSRKVVCRSCTLRYRPGSGAAAAGAVFLWRMVVGAVAGAVAGAATWATCSGTGAPQWVHLLLSIPIALGAFIMASRISLGPDDLPESTGDDDMPAPGEHPQTVDYSLSRRCTECDSVMAVAGSNP